MTEGFKQHYGRSDCCTWKDSSAAKTSQLEISRSQRKSPIAQQETRTLTSKSVQRERISGRLGQHSHKLRPASWQNLARLSLVQQRNPRKAPTKQVQGLQKRSGRDDHLPAFTVPCVGSCYLLSRSFSPPVARPSVERRDRAGVDRRLCRYPRNRRPLICRSELAQPCNPRCRPPSVNLPNNLAAARPVTTCTLTFRHK